MPTQLPAAYQIPTLQKMAASYLTDSAQVKRAASTRDGLGGLTDTWNNQGAAVGCLVASYTEKNATEESRRLRFVTTFNWIVYLPVGADVKVTDRIVVNGASTYEVRGIDGSGSTLSAVTVCWCEEVHG